MTAPLASAEDLDRHRARVVAQLAQSQHDLGESTEQLQDAAAAVESAQAQLTMAQQQLTLTKQRLETARAKDAAMAAKLKRAREQLAVAKAAVVTGQQELDAENTMAGNLARDQYQQQTNLLPMAILLADQTATDLQTRLQWGSTMLDTTQAQIARLKVLQQKLTAQRARQSELEQQVADDRVQAGRDLDRRKHLEQQAATETANVASLLRQRNAVRAAAAVAVTQDRQQILALNRERASVEQRIAIRIARAKAEAERKAAAARAAKLAAERAAAQRAAKRASEAADSRRARAADRRADRAAAQRRAAAEKRATNQDTDKRSAKKSDQRRAKVKARKSSRRSGSKAHHGFIYPVNSSISSPYGRRFHPVLHIWKLHDGTDFGAGCGTPIRAAYSGRVAERYYSGAYGNRLMIDHGDVSGRYVTTGYNHAQRYRVRVGQRVRKGQAIGYVGSTGYSTGCHLHLMVWLDGRRVNPMSWY